MFKFEVWFPSLCAVAGLIANALIWSANVGRMGGEIATKLDQLTSDFQELKTSLATLQHDSAQRNLLVAKIEMLVVEIQKETRFQRRWRHWAHGVFHTLALKTGTELQMAPEMEE